MPEIEETDLPGVGLRFEFVTDAGNRIGVIHHRSGRRELFACEADDPDAVSVSLRLSDDESHALADALGGSTVVENLTTLEQRIEGLAIDWLGVGEGTPYVGRTLGEAGVRTRTGVSVVAVIRGDTAVPAPGPDFLVMASDVLVVVGTTDGIASVKQILSSG